MKRFVWVQIPSSAPNKEDMPLGMSFLFYKDGGFEIGRKLRSNLSEGPNSLNDCLSAKAATGGNPVIRTNKKGTFGRQKFLFCLSKPQVWYIIAARSVLDIISPFGAVYHHALACIPLRLDDIQTFGLMIYCNKLRMIYTAFALIYLRECVIINSPINKNL